MFGKLLNLLKTLVETVLAWCVGFLITGCLFALLIFYIVPFFADIPLDAGKYIARTNAQIAENKGHAPEEEVVVPVVVENVRPLSETILESVDKAADNIIRWINEPEN